MTQSILTFVLALIPGVGLLFGYRVQRNGDRAAPGRAIMLGVLVVVSTSLVFGAALWIADEEAIDLPQAERTARLLRETSTSHVFFRLGLVVGTLLTLFGVGRWCIAVFRNVRDTTWTTSEREEQTDDLPRHRWSALLRDGVDEAGVRALLEEIVERFGSFEIHDVHYPTISDPGAYISYARYDPQAREWQMSLGNHGWSGGIYVIRHEVVVCQLLNLANSVGEVELMSDAAFFSHYEPEPPEKNEEMNARLAKIHGCTRRVI